MAERDQPQQETHKVFTVVKREGKDDYWLNLGLVFPHKDGKGFSLFTNAWPHDGKLVCREIGEKEPEQEPSRPERNDRQQRRGR
jgi:hypothetical protein